MNDLDTKSTKHLVPDELWPKLQALCERLRTQRVPAREDVMEFRLLMRQYPDLLESLSTLSHEIRSQMMGQLVDGWSQARMLAEEDAIKEETNYARATPMERLLIDQICTARCHMLAAEAIYSTKMAKETSVTIGAYWQNFLESAQRRFHRSIETLARVRRLSRHTPFLQVNIANAASRQLNIQGELFQSELPLASDHSSSSAVSDGGGCVPRPR